MKKGAMSFAPRYVSQHVLDILIEMDFKLTKCFNMF